MFVTFLLFQRNLYVVLACGKGPKNSAHRYPFKTKTPSMFAPRPPQTSCHVLHGTWIDFWPD